MLPASAVAELLRLGNPSVDWGMAIAALGITKKTTTTTDVPPKVTAPAPATASQTTTEEPALQPTPQAEPLNSKPSYPKIAETSEIPLDVSPVSVYEHPAVKALREEEERVLETEERVDERDVERCGGVEGEATETVERGGVVEGVTRDEGGEGQKGEKKAGEVEEVEVEEIEIEEEGEKSGEEKKDEQTDPEGRVVETEEGKGESSAKQRLMTDEEFEELLKGVQAREAKKDEKIERKKGEGLKELLDRASKKGKVLTYEEVDEVLREIEAEEKRKKEADRMAESQHPECVEGKSPSVDNVAKGNEPEAEVDTGERRGPRGTTKCQTEVGAEG